MEETILTSDKPVSSSPLDPPSRRICHVCQKQFSQYTCPRCNSRYCSLQCYKSHSLRCTETFMRENVIEELRHMKPDDGTKHKMLDILKRFHSEEETESMEEDEPTLSEETIQKIMSGAEISLDDLSPEEKRHFQRAIASGELSKLIEPWDPWWLKPSSRSISLGRDGTQLIQPLTKQEKAVSLQDDVESDQSNEVPPGPETSLPSVNKLSSTEPSPLLAVHLVDIIYSYCFALRLYNGDWQSDAAGSALVVLSVSCVLGQGGQPETVLEALSYCLEQTCSPAYRHMGGLQFGLGLIDDVLALLSLGGPALVCLLCDLQRLILAAESELQAEKSQRSKRVEINKLKRAERKIYFMMCWVYEQPAEVWSSLEAIVRAERTAAMDFEGSKRPVKVENKAKTTGKLLIEEV